MTLSDILPTSIKLYFYLAAAAALIGGTVIVYYKIERAGYNRCESAYAKAADEIKATADKNIQKVSRKYDDQKTEIHRQVGPNDPVGPRTKLAIDRLHGRQRDSDGPR